MGFFPNEIAGYDGLGQTFLRAQVIAAWGEKKGALFFLPFYLHYPEDPGSEGCPGRVKKRNVL